MRLVGRCVQRLLSKQQQRSMASISKSAGVYTAVVTEAELKQAVPEDAKDLKHHVNGRFQNPWPSYTSMSGPQIAAAMIGRRIRGEGHSPDTTPPTVNVQDPKFLPARDTQELRATWLGHACFLVEFPGGLRALFDPVFSQRCSPFQSMGPLRYTKMPCQISDIPFIDIVCISHNHYDHMDLPTINAILKHNPKVHFFVPLKTKQWFTDTGINQVTELDWWEEKDLLLTLDATEGSKEENSVSPTEIKAKIGCLPCQHATNRGLFDRYAMLWSSWSIETGGKKVYFAGDTGYRRVPKIENGVDDYGEEYKDLPVCPAFKQIGDLRGPFDLGLIPIGAYQPRWIMSPMHANPYDSVNIFVETKCKRALGMHWGTWVLTEEPVLEPPKLLKEALKKKDIAEEGVFDVCDIGESREFAPKL